MLRRIVLILFASTVFALNAGADDKPLAKEISVTDAAPLLGQENVYWIDCRELEEWEAGHIDGATLHPKSRIEMELAKLAGKQDQRIIVYCRSGRRSLAVTELLRGKGFAKTQSMAGGYLKWSEEKPAAK